MDEMVSPWVWAVLAVIAAIVAVGVFYLLRGLWAGLRLDSRGKERKKIGSMSESPPDAGEDAGEDEMNRR